TRSSLSAEERSALARSLFAQLKEPPNDEAAAGPAQPGAAAPAQAAATSAPLPVPPTTFGGIRVVGPAAQAQAAQAQAQARAQAQSQSQAQAQAARAKPQAAAPTKAQAAARAAFSPAALPPPARTAASAAPPPRTRLRFRLLPVTIFVLVLMLGLRVGDSWRVLTRGGSLPEVSPVVAQTPPAPGKDAGKEGKEPGKDAGKDQPKGKDASKDDRAAKEAETATMLLGREPRPDTIDLELVKHLTERREELEKRGHDMDQREALIAAGEKRLDQKMTELQAVKVEIQNLLKQVDDKQRAQIESLVRIYENMKPKDAARIFEALEMPVLMEVVERMKEAKTAPVLAAMDPIKAKDLTTALAERRRLPAMPQ
ncbi:MAG: hypothetical protein WCJ64_09165, partial [Rhodospirillaceae bacterium]